MQIYCMTKKHSYQGELSNTRHRERRSRDVESGKRRDPIVTLNVSYTVNSSFYKFKVLSVTYFVTG